MTKEPYFMTRKMRIGIVLTAIWITLNFIGVIVQRRDRDVYLFLMLIPPMIGWGIWWIRKG